MRSRIVLVILKRFLTVLRTLSLVSITSLIVLVNKLSIAKNVVIMFHSHCKSNMEV